MDTPEIFDRNARRTRRRGIAAAQSADRWLIRRMAEELLGRWQERGTDAHRVLVLGHDDGVIRTALAGLGVRAIFADVCGPEADIICDEDRLPFGDAVFDVVFACGSMDSVNDLPGALILIRRSLAAGGLFLGAMLGAGSGVLLRSAVMEVVDDEPMVARAHPQIDVRAAGDLLARAGFANPVADMDCVEARYQTMDAALTDRRANGLGNVLSQRVPVSKFRARAWRDRVSIGGKPFTETFVPIYMTGEVPPAIKPD